MARNKVQLYRCGNKPEYTAGACLLDSVSVDDMSQVRKVNDRRQAWTHWATFLASGLRENGPWRGPPWHTSCRWWRQVLLSTALHVDKLLFGP